MDRGEPTPTPHELPPDVYAFAGRDAALAELDALLDEASGPAAAVGIAAVSGTAGVGKTALAVHWAHRVADRFPDGQLYVDLRGYDPDLPTEPADALARFLRALGVTGASVPPDLAERAARFRTALAGRRVLVLLDNAYSVEQVRPLLPGTPGCFVVVTSRDALPGLVARHGAHRVELDLLTESDAVDLLATLVGQRARAEVAGGAALVRRCAGLPLALRIAAELAAARPRAPLADLAAELADERRRLDLLDAAADERTAVSVVFSWSYRQLPPPAAEAFRLLGLHPGADFDGYAVSALTGTDLGRAREMLDTLMRAHLVRYLAPGRYAMHDLLRAYARARAADDGAPDQRAALVRLLHSYLGTAGAAMDALYPAERHRRPRVPRPRTPTPSVADPATAQSWLDAERANLVAMTGHAAGHGWPTEAGYFAATLARYLDIGAHYPDGMTVHGHALRAARAHGDRYAEGRALFNLGHVYWRWGRFADAHTHYRQALDLAREDGDRTGEAWILVELGTLHRMWARFDEAVGYFEQAGAICVEVGDRMGLGRSLGNLAIVYDQVGRYDEAVETYRRALAIFRDGGDRLSEGITLGNLGGAYGRLARYDEALETLRQALSIVRDLGHLASAGDMIDEIGLVCERSGRDAEALEHYERAVAMQREIGNREGEAVALAHLGGLHLRLGRFGPALDAFEPVVDLARDLGNRPQQARALDGLAGALHGSRRPDEARERWTAALALYESLDLAAEADAVRHRLG